ncbi:MAG: DoxX family membrane protein [Propionibacteriaceae bacterium]|nr:DoxX family membrane protein [Propionibacteriaceae bacterium]
MTAPGRLWTRDPKNWIGVACRLIIGGALLWAGLAKVGDLQLSVQQVRDYDILPFGLTRFVGSALPIGELVVGVLIVSGAFTRVMAALGSLLMAAYMAAIASLWARGLVLDCGCFGAPGEVADFAAARAGYIWDLLRDLVFLAAGVWLVWRPAAKPSLDQWLFQPLETDVEAIPPR